MANNNHRAANAATRIYRNTDTRKLERRARALYVVRAERVDPYLGRAVRDTMPAARRTLAPLLEWWKAQGVKARMVRV